MKQAGAASEDLSSFPSPGFAAIALALLATLTYVGTLAHPFVYDDLPLVLKNPEIRSLANLPAIIGFHDGGFSARSRFTREISYTLEFACVGPWPPLYRLTNILLHTLNALLCLTIFRRLTGERLLAWLAAVLFVVHPVATDVVAQISGRRELLATLFSLATIALLQRYVDRGGWGRLAAALGCLYLGIFSKEMAVMAPAAFVAADLFGALRAGGTRPATTLLWEHLRRRRLLYGGLFLAMVALTAFRLFLTDGGADRAGTRGFYDSTGASLGILAHARLVGLGLRLLVLPWGLTPDYSYDALELTTPGPSVAAGIDLFVLLAAAAATIAGLWKRSWLGLGCALFFLLILPTSGIVPWHEIFAERFLYFPSIGFYLAAAGLLVGAFRSVRFRRAAAGLIVLVVASLGGATIARGRAWESSERLWAGAVDRYPRCARAHKALADVYLADGRTGAALSHYEEAVRILPAYHDAQVAVAAALVASGRSEEGQRAFEKVLERWPEDAKALNGLGMIYEDRGDLDTAFDRLERARQSDPLLAEPYNNLGRILAMRGDLPAAIRLYEQAVERDPSLVPALRNLATLHRYGMHDEATAQRYDDRVRELLAVR